VTVTPYHLHVRLDNEQCQIPNVPFSPAWWVPGPHAQTLWGKIGRHPMLPDGQMERWDTPDGDFLDVFRTRAPKSAPHLIVLHGLEGTLRSHYARGILQRAVAAGWGSDLLLFRGCGNEPNRTARFYHSGETGDLAQTVERIVAEYPLAPIVLAGYSLGGNVLLKWLGEEAAHLPSNICGAAAVSVPFDLEAGARYIGRGLSRIYERHFLRTLKAKAAVKLRRFPGLFDPDALTRARTIIAFDDAVTAPVHGFDSASDYYTRSSSAQFLPKIQIPTLLISAYDDPFLPAEVLRSVALLARENPALCPLFSPHGGHVGFVSGRVPGRPRYDSEDRIMSFFAACVEFPPIK